MTRPKRGMLTLLDDGLWDADARLELEELAEAVDPRLSSDEDEVDTLGGLVFLLAGHIPDEGRMRDSPVRLEARSRRFRPAPDHPRPPPRARGATRKPD